jgi:DNA-binding XRE family transcriptional regulator
VKKSSVIEKLERVRGSVQPELRPALEHAISIAIEAEYVADRASNEVMAAVSPAYPPLVLLLAADVTEATPAQGFPARTLGEAIKEGRTRLGLSQRALAAKMTELGVSMDGTAVTRLENNQREPRLSEGIALSRFLNFDLFSLESTGGMSS